MEEATRQTFLSFLSILPVLNNDTGQPCISYFTWPNFFLYSPYDQFTKSRDLTCSIIFIAILEIQQLNAPNLNLNNLTLVKLPLVLQVFMLSATQLFACTCCLILLLQEWKLFQLNDMNQLSQESYRKCRQYIRKDLQICRRLS
jgi:hypothetical protein